ncbi:MAG: hypothetical protein FVQ77_13340 [Cytophagales bacterium]|nr:hypothetical protein [Cytophagales bacterium]
MKLPANIIIEKSKLTEYLLKKRERNDKAGFLDIAGYNLENWEQLDKDLRNHVLNSDATIVEQNEYGTFYKINSELKGPMKTLKITAICMYDKQKKQYKFITLYPFKE